VGAAHGVSQVGERRAPVPGAGVLERRDHLIVLPQIARRLVATIPVMGVVAIAVFALLHVTPGDPAVIIAGDYATAEDIAKIRAKLGLDQPFLTQVTIWLGRIVRGDLGTSIYSGLPVATLIGQRAEATIALTLFAMIISVGVAVPLGVLAAWRKGSLVDRAVMVFAVSGFSMPTFWLGFVLVYVFAVSFHWLPVQGFQPLERGAWPFLRHLILPAATLSLVFMALIARMTRASMLGVLNEDYIRTAFAKGLAPRRVLVRHALKNASLPIVTIIGIGFALLIGGAVVTESVFALPGLGRLTVDAIIRRDYPVIQGVILVVSGVYVLINLVVDLLYVVLDPRIRY
jgi:peptide/nickel transport system permease protein